jgi:hypothetical protein
MFLISCSRNWYDETPTTYILGLDYNRTRGLGSGLPGI